MSARARGRRSRAPRRRGGRRRGARDAARREDGRGGTGAAPPGRDTGPHRLLSVSRPIGTGLRRTAPRRRCGRHGARDPERELARPPPSGARTSRSTRPATGRSDSWTRTCGWAAGRPGRAPRTSSRIVPGSGNTWRGRSRTRSCSPTRSWARGRTATATSSTSARRSPVGFPTPDCTPTRAGARHCSSVWATSRRHSSTTISCTRCSGICSASEPATAWRRSRAFRRTHPRIASRPWAPRRRARERSPCSTRSA